MFTRPDGIDDDEVRVALRRHWAFPAVTLEYRAVGFGSYHWLALDSDGARRFVTVDELRQGDEAPEHTFGRLERAFAAASALHAQAGLGFVVAPLTSAVGAVVHRLTEGYSIALFPYVDGSSSAFGEHTPADREAVLELLVRLHRATSAVGTSADDEDFELPFRSSLERSLGQLREPWNGGPYSEPARQLLAVHASSIVERLRRYDDLRAGVAADRSRWVVTHGEPHAGNVIRTPGGLVLVDWDTLRVGPPERDLWMVLGRGEDLVRRYEVATGMRVEPDVAALYRLWWNLTEIATYVAELRGAHVRDADTDVSWRSLRAYAADEFA